LTLLTQIVTQLLIYILNWFDSIRSGFAIVSNLKVAKILNVDYFQVSLIKRIAIRSFFFIFSYAEEKHKSACTGGEKKYSDGVSCALFFLLKNQSSRIGDEETRVHSARQGCHHRASKDERFLSCTRSMAQRTKIRNTIRSLTI